MLRERERFGEENETDVYVYEKGVLFFTCRWERREWFVVVFLLQFFPTLRIEDIILSKLDTQRDARACSFY